jgi:hypothetical protein
MQTPAGGVEPVLERADGSTAQDRADAVAVTGFADTYRLPDTLCVPPIVVPVSHGDEKFDPPNAERIHHAVEFPVESDRAIEVPIGAAPFDLDVFA